MTRRKNLMLIVSIDTPQSIAWAIHTPPPEGTSVVLVKPHMPREWNGAKQLDTKPA